MIDAHQCAGKDQFEAQRVMTADAEREPDAGDESPVDRRPIPPTCPKTLNKLTTPTARGRGLFGLASIMAVFKVAPGGT